MAIAMTEPAGFLPGCGEGCRPTLAMAPAGATKRYESIIAHDPLAHEAHGRGAPDPREPITRVPGLEIDRARRQVLVDGAPTAITASEFCVLQALAERPGEVVPYDALLRVLWGSAAEDYAWSRSNGQSDRYHVVRIHVARLRRGLDPSARERFVATRPGWGYWLVTENTPATEARPRPHPITPAGTCIVCPCGARFTMARSARGRRFCRVWCPAYREDQSRQNRARADHRTGTVFVPEDRVCPCGAAFRVRYRHSAAQRFCSAACPELRAHNVRLIRERRQAKIGQGW